jgi:hypothetical protein
LDEGKTPQSGLRGRLRQGTRKTNGDEGNRTIPISASETPIPEPRGTESGTVAAPKNPSDPDLTLIQEQWPFLSGHVKAAIKALVRSASKEGAVE